jgi:hypothetical protein
MPREIKIGDTLWSCVQAYAGLSDESPAAEATESSQVTVVCTPSGGEKSLRLELRPDWEQLPDEELVKAINSGRK